MRILPLVLVLCSLAQAQAAQKDFDMRFNAPFLEAGLNGQAPAGDEPMRHGAIEWTSATEGRMPVSLWYKKGVVGFETTPDRKTLTALRVELGHNGMDVWRRRHAYLKIPGQGYVWDSLADVRPVMDSASGEAYDACLLGVWTLWARRELPGLLAAQGALQETLGFDDSGYGELKKKMTVRYDRNGLVGTASGEFYLRLWGVPVHVAFTIKGHRPTHENPWLIDLAKGIEVSYRRDEWRKRHGYARGGAWDADFTEPKPDIAQAGPLLDALLDKDAQYWSEAAVHIILNGLHEQLAEAIGSAAQPAPLALSRSKAALQALEAGQAWPQ